MRLNESVGGGKISEGSRESTHHSTVKVPAIKSIKYPPSCGIDHLGLLCEARTWSGGENRDDLGIQQSGGAADLRPIWWQAVTNLRRVKDVKLIKSSEAFAR